MSGIALMKKSIYGKQKFLWGNIPAVDVVNHAKNEGVDLPEDFNLLFAGNVFDSLIDACF